MAKLYVQKLVVVGGGGAAAGLAALTLSSTGVAGAQPSVTGKTFSEAQATLGSMGYTAVVSTVIGDKATQANCMVVRQQDFPGGAQWAASTVNSIFTGNDQPTLYPIHLPNEPTTGQVFLTLGCYNSKDVAAGQATGSGDINTKPGS